MMNSEETQKDLRHVDVGGAGALIEAAFAVIVFAQNRREYTNASPAGRLVYGEEAKAADGIVFRAR